MASGVRLLVTMMRGISPHPFEEIMLQELKALSAHLAKELITLLEVYVDDFIGMINKTSLHHLRQLSRAMLHGIHSVYSPPDITGYCGADPFQKPN